ncbi:hypothetical protein RDI58_027005 [Solanum bulbocastanum]|uniref:Uncharacterized protein n=1 Tax=Solanum bulbocastanum TaxID=147425 RepID=A0AAN8Y1N9_SOLBU
MSTNPMFNHIDLAEKQKVVNECGKAEAWFRKKIQQQDAPPKFANPVHLSADVQRKAEALDRVCRPIITKPKPATPETPSCQSPQRGETQPPTAESPNAGNAKCNYRY